MSYHRTLTINLARIILAAGVALPASFGTSLAAEQPSLEDITLRTPRATRGMADRTPGGFRNATSPQDLIH